MFKFYFILTAVSVLAFAGCAEQPAKEKVWEKVKIGDLAAPQLVTDVNSELTADLAIHVIELPSENLSTIAPIWDILYQQPIQFTDKQAFYDNGFMAGFGIGGLWQKVLAVLDEAEAEKIETNSIVLGNGQSFDISLRRITDSRTIFFYDSNKSREQKVQVSLGRLAFTVRADRIAGQRGVTKVTVIPSFVKVKLKAIKQLEGIERQSDIFFKLASFAVDMTPGDYILLGPKSYTLQYQTLEQFLFSYKKEVHDLSVGKNIKEMVRLYLLVCGQVGY